METLKYQRDKADKRPIWKQQKSLVEYLEERSFEVYAVTYDDNYLIMIGEEK